MPPIVRININKLKALWFKYKWVLTYSGLIFLTISNYNLRKDYKELAEENAELKSVVTQAVAKNINLKDDIVIFNRSYEPFPFPTWQKVKRDNKYIMQYVNPAYVAKYGHEFDYNRYARIGLTDYETTTKKVADKWYKWDKVVAMSGEPLLVDEIVMDTTGNIEKIRVLKWREIERRDTLVYGMVITKDL